MTVFKHWLTPPVYPGDEIQTNRARVLNVSLQTLAVLVLFLIIGNLLGGRTPLAVLVVDVAAFLVCLTLVAILHHGGLRPASIGLMAMSLLLITGAAVSLGTIRAPNTACFLLLVLSAGLLFDLRGIAIMAVLCSLAVGGLALAETHGWLPQRDFTVTITQWITYTVLFAWTGSLTYTSIQSTRRALERAQTELQERRRAEEALRQGERRYRLLAENVSDVIWTMDRQGRLTYVSPSAGVISEYSAEQLLTEPLERIVAPGSLALVHQRIQEHLEALSRGLPQDPLVTQVEQLNPDGGTSWSEVVSRIVPEADDPNVAILGVTRDITRRKEAEDAIKKLLSEKEILLREVNHRIKNTLYMISALLDLQADTLSDPAAVQAFHETSGRITGMMSIYDTLSRSDDFLQINLHTYMTSLIGIIIQGWQTPERQVWVTQDIEAIDISIQAAIPLGMIVNEWITNAYKYAFSKGAGGILRIVIRRRGDGQVEVCVADNGIGLPEDVDVQAPTTFGLSLVKILSGQLGGSLSVERQGGVTQRLVFPFPMKA